MLTAIFYPSCQVKEPELRYTPSGIPVCFFMLAVDRDYRDKDGKREADFNVKHH